MPLFPSKKNTKTIGDSAEAKARNYLSQQGIKIIESNFHCKMGEIDIIAEHNNTVLFVEVKFRKNRSYGTPAETVTPQKQNKLIRSAQLYLQKHPNLGNKACRFDVISIEADKINWIQNAFDAY